MYTVQIGKNAAEMLWKTTWMVGDNVLKKGDIFAIMCSLLKNFGKINRGEGN
jgi:hypothetical protein